MPLLVMAAGLLSICLAERIPANGGLGFDGIHYGAWAKDYANQVFIHKVSAYHSARILPSAIVHYGLRLLRMPLDDLHVVKGFQVWNLLWLCIAVLAWNAIGDALGLSLRGRWFGFLGLFINFANLKQSYYYPVLTDTAGFGMGMLMLESFLRSRSNWIFLLTALGGFVWPPLLPMGAALYILPRRDVIVHPAASRWNQAAALLFAAAFALGVVYIYFILQTPIANAAPPVFHPLAVFSLLLAAITLFLAVYFLLDSDYLWSWDSWRKQIHWPRALTMAILMAAVAWAHSVVTNPQLPSSNTANVLCWILLGSIAKPWVFIVAHAVYFGPIILLTVMLWPRICRHVQSYGAGLVAFLLYAICVSLGSESRQDLSALPFLVAFTAKASDDLPMPSWVCGLFAAAALFLSKFWYLINRVPAPDFKPIHFQRYYMHHGPLCTWESYVPQAVLVFAIGLALWLGIRSYRKDQSIQFDIRSIQASLLPYLIMGLTLIAFCPLIYSGLFSVEDRQNIFGMLLRHYSVPLGFDFLRQSLNQLTMALEYPFAKLDARGYHFTNLCVHGLNAGLVYWISLRLYGHSIKTQRASGSLPWAAAIASIVFSCHPMKAGPVAWISRRGFLLSAGLCLACVLAYLIVQEKGQSRVGRRWWLGLSLACFGLSLWSVPYGFTLPAVLLILDIYPLGRFNEDTRPRWQTGRPVLIEKIPFILLALAFVVFSKQGYPVSIGSVSQMLRGTSYYLQRIFYFDGLRPMDAAIPIRVPLEFRGASSWAALSMPVAISAAAFFCRKKWPACWVAWASFLLLPVFCLGASGYLRGMTGDEWAYLAAAPLAVLVGGGLFCLLAEPPLVVASLGLAILFGILSWRQSELWNDPVQIWAGNGASNPGNYSSHYNLAWQYVNRRRYDDAIVHAKGLIRPKNDNAYAYAWLARAYFGKGMLREGAAAGKRSREIDGSVADSYAMEYFLEGYNLGQEHKVDEAVASTRASLSLNPDSAKAQANLGVLLAEQGHLNEAIEQIQAAVRMNPIPSSTIETYLSC